MSAGALDSPGEPENPTDVLTDALDAASVPRVPGRTRYAVVVDDDLSQSILDRLSAMLAWDHSTGASIREQAVALSGLTGTRPYVRTPVDGTGPDREALGWFVPGVLPYGLERLLGAK